jgi:hypothetical protein
MLPHRRRFPGIAPVQDSMAGANAGMAGAIAIKPDIPEDFSSTGCTEPQPRPRPA